MGQDDTQHGQRASLTASFTWTWLEAWDGFQLQQHTATSNNQPQALSQGTPSSALDVGVTGGQG